MPISNRRKLIRRLSFPAVAVLMLMGIASVGCSRQEPSSPPTTADRTKVKVGYLPVSTTLPNWVANAEGIAAKHGVDVEFVRYANSDLLMMGLVNGEVQATSVCGDEPVLAAASRGALDAQIYLQEILTTDRVFEAIIVRADSSINSIKDLAGKTVACFPGSQLRAYLRVILQRAGVDPESVNIQQLPPPNMLPALEGKTVDACMALEPVITLGVNKGVARILVASPIVTYIGEGKSLCAASFLISKTWADGNPKSADGFVRSVYEAVQMIENDYAKTSSRYPEFTPIPAELAGKVVITHFATIDSPDKAGLKLEERVLREAGQLDGPVDVDSLIYQWRSK